VKTPLARIVRTILLGALIAAALAACSRAEPQAVVSKPTAPVAVPAAARMAEKPVQAPAPEPASRAAAPEQRRAQAASKPPKAPVARAVPPALPAMLDGSSRESLALVPSPGFVEPPRTAAPKAEAPKAEAPKAEAPMPVAAAAPARAPAPARVVSRVEPDFPRSAFQARVDRGLVKARMTLDGSGNVTRVDIVDAQPRRVFDTAVASALAQWKFNDGAAGRTYDTEVVFQR
jgi:protein TonB